MFIVFWLIFLLFVLTSFALTAIVIMQEPKQGGLGEGLGRRRTGLYRLYRRHCRRLATSDDLPRRHLGTVSLGARYRT